MHVGDGIVKEITLFDGIPAARIHCPPNLIPLPGQYLLAHAGASDAPLAVPVFSIESNSDHFLTSPIPVDWHPGVLLHMRGPLGRGFAIPASARRVALIAWDDVSNRLFPLIRVAFSQEASVTLVMDNPPDALPLQVEVQPFSALDDVIQWADYTAIDTARESLSVLKERLGNGLQAKVPYEAQVLISTPMPCGGLADCGVCAIHTSNGWEMACKDGPVFRLHEII